MFPIVSGRVSYSTSSLRELHALVDKWTHQFGPIFHVFRESLALNSHDKRGWEFCATVRTFDFFAICNEITNKSSVFTGNESNHKTLSTNVIVP